MADRGLPTSSDLARCLNAVACSAVFAVVVATVIVNGSGNMWDVIRRPELC